MIVARLLAFTLRVGAAWVLWLLIGLSVLSVMVMLDRWLYFGKRRMSRRFPEPLRLCQQGELPQAARLAPSSITRRSTLAHVRRRPSNSDGN